MMLAKGSLHLKRRLHVSLRMVHFGKKLPLPSLLLGRLIAAPDAGESALETDALELDVGHEAGVLSQLSQTPQRRRARDREQHQQQNVREHFLACQGRT